jgi:hypothetical protein
MHAFNMDTSVYSGQKAEQLGIIGWGRRSSRHLKNRRQLRSPDEATASVFRTRVLYMQWVSQFSTGKNRRRAGGIAMSIN